MMPFVEAENVLVGIETKDDACVYLFEDDRVVVQTIDFFTPIVDDPFIFGKIAACNALSDIYAMGAEPSFALSIVAFPCDLGMDVLMEIVRGGNEKMKEAGVVVLGGHSVDDPEPKYGFCVTGFTTADKVIRNSTAQPGDYLYLTKPIGTGIMATAIKAKMISESDVSDLLQQTMRLNKNAKDAAVKAKATALTDVTGFGLIGHAYEMAKGAGLSVEIYASRVPIYEGALEFASYGVMPAGLHDNKRYVENNLSVDGEVDHALLDLLFDPQTSGGLLIAVREDMAKVLEEELKSLGELVARVGRFYKETPGFVKIIP